MRIGNGFDVHKFTKNRELFLGGIKIPYELGLEGHSDADVLLHAICDAILGAIGLGDIGLHFPDNDLSYKNIASKELLKKTNKMLKDKSYKICNIDATIIAEKPKISPYRDKIKQNIANILNIDFEKINIKATTTEQLGFIGRKQGIAAMCVVLIDNI